MKPYDALIIGRGVAGLSIASSLRKRGLRVAIVHKPTLRGESSLAAAGILDPLLELTPNSPMLSLRLEAFRCYPDYLTAIQKQTGSDAGYQLTQMLYAALNEREEQEVIKMFTWQKKMGIPMKLLSAGQIKKMEPSLNRNVRTGILYPSVGRVYAAELVSALIKGAHKDGIDFIQTRGDVKLLFEKSGVQGLRIGRRIIPSGQVVAASGSWLGQMKSLPIKIPVFPVRGEVYVVKVKNGSKRVLHSSDGYYTVPWVGGTQLMGATVENVGYRPEVTQRGYSEISKSVFRLVPSLKKAKVVKSWAGLRPGTADEKPLIGKTSIKGFYLAAGYYRSGILVGHYAGELLAEAIVTGRVPQELKPFDPMRRSCQNTGAKGGRRL